MAETPENILDQLSTIIMELGAIREKTTDQDDRAALNSQIKALTKWCRKIDDERAGQSDEDITQATNA